MTQWLKCLFGYHEWGHTLTLVDYDVCAEWGAGYPVSQYATVSSIAEGMMQGCKHCGKSREVKGE